GEARAASGGGGEVDDWALLEAAAGMAGLETLFERHRDYVYRLSVGFLGRLELAEDATQEVFLRLARTRRPFFRRRARFTTWLYRITLNVCRELRRRRRRETPLDSPEVSDPVALPGDPTLSDLHAALLHLPERQREAVVLRYLEGLSTRETAAVLGCGEGSVKTHLHRALAALRSNLIRAAHPPGCRTVPDPPSTPRRPPRQGGKP
ncbi:MAG: RNA polymerase sigma factor, partial [Holophagales bacterium]|nr:RNA polymerase sigma factor [Holophagales bacterium]